MRSDGRPECGPIQWKHLIDQNSLDTRDTRFHPVSIKTGWNLGRAMARWMAACGLVVLQAGAAMAHPHVWVTAKSEFVFEGKELTAVKHIWAFDDAYSQYATQGLARDSKGQIDRKDLDELAAVNVESLHEFDFFTHARADGKKVVFLDPVDSGLDYKDGALILHFTLPLKQAMPATRSLSVEVYDSTYFVSFVYAPGDDAVQLAGAQPGCSKTITRPEQQVFSDEELSEAFFNALTSASRSGHDFATRALVACP